MLARLEPRVRVCVGEEEQEKKRAAFALRRRLFKR